MAQKKPSDKPQVSEKLEKIKSELSEKALDQVAGGLDPRKRGRGSNGG